MKRIRAIILVLVSVFVLALCAFTLSWPSLAQMPIVGHAEVVDGDTLRLQGERIRLFGIDAPERDQVCLNDKFMLYRCGEAARAHLITLIANRKVECWAEVKDHYNRWVATCTVDGKDIGDAMVRAGHAIDYPRYSKGVYAKAEAEARENRRGIHLGVFENPAKVRRAKELGR